VPETHVVLLLVLAALAAGFVDAVVGGGGLIQLPALAIAMPGAAPVQLLATNKIASVCGTSASAATFYRRTRPDPGTFGPLMAAAFVGALGGALCASLLSRAAFNPMILAVLVIVGAIVAFRPGLGTETVLRFGQQDRKHLLGAVLIGLLVGAYDGLLGPGTGSFFVFGLVMVLGYNFIDASAKAKLANWATNVAALVVFVPQGAVMWRVGLLMGAANLVGGYVGARTAVAKGSVFVRIFFMVVVSAFIIRIGGEVLGLWA
jgi:uncharacterized protein